MSTVLITGASSGIGRAAASRIRADEGRVVIGMARRPEAMPRGIIPLKADLATPGAAATALAGLPGEVAAPTEFVHCAGYADFAPLELCSPEEAVRQMRVGLFSAAELISRLLPAMRRAGRGRIVLVSSIASRFSSPMGGWYHATKYAVEALSDALRMEVADFGIDVVLIEPGAIRTDWGTIAADHLEDSARGGAYEEAAGRTAASMRRLYASRRMSDPQVVVRAIRRAVEARRPRTRYLVGLGAKPLVAARALLPTRLFDRIMRGAAAG